MWLCPLIAVQIRDRNAATLRHGTTGQAMNNYYDPGEGGGGGGGSTEGKSLLTQPPL
jgi:hypothetical protein